MQPRIIKKFRKNRNASSTSIPVVSPWRRRRRPVGLGRLELRGACGGCPLGGRSGRPPWGGRERAAGIGVGHGQRSLAAARSWNQTENVSQQTRGLRCCQG